MSRDTALDHLVSVPIPTYEEAISRPSSSQRNLGPTETSHDAQRQGLLHGSSQAGHRQPTVESARNSMESDLSIPDMVNDEHYDRRALEELDYLEPGESENPERRRYHRARLRGKIAQQLSNIGATLGAIRIPSFRRPYTAVPPPSTEEGDEQEPPPTWRSRFSRSIHIPEQYRMSVPTFARLCALFTIAAFVWFLFSMNFFPRRHNMMSTMFEPESVRVFIQEHVDSGRISTYLEHIASYAHEAGSEGSYFMANWMLNTWHSVCEFDDDALSSYSIMANYPIEGQRSVKVSSLGKEQWAATIEENILDTGREQTLAWLGYSANGNAKGPLIYANAGSRDDFQYLRNEGIATNGSIALVHIDANHAPQSMALKIRFAEEAGCIGVLIFNGDILATQDMQTWPNSALPGNDSVHRGSAALSNWILGDPLSPGYASTKGARRDHDAASLALSTIPSIPLSWRDASTLLSLLDGRGEKIPASWLATNAYSGSHDSDEAVVVDMQNDNDVVDSQQVWQVRARIEGAESPQMKVVVGAPRDSWCFGASHSASASAVLVEVINIFGDLRQLGWRPLRSIEFISWDANTFNAAGSTEYVEDNTKALREEGVAYINVNAGISGPELLTSGSPLLQRSLQHALNRVNLPGAHQTMAEAFTTPLRYTAGLTDSAPFTHIAGMPSLNMQFSGEASRWVHGSCYDTYDWVRTNSDSTDDLAYHKALAQLWALVVLDIASSPLIPLDARAYADSVASDVDEFKKQVLDYVATHAPGEIAKNLGLDFKPLHDAVTSLQDSALQFHAFEDVWTTGVLAQGGMEDLYQNRQRLGWNWQIMQFEKALIDLQQHKDDGTQGGLKDRPQFRHVLMAPEKFSDGLQLFPSIWEYLEEQKWEKAGHEIERISGMIQSASEPLAAGW